MYFFHVCDWLIHNGESKEGDTNITMKTKHEILLWGFHNRNKISLNLPFLRCDCLTPCKRLNYLTKFTEVKKCNFHNDFSFNSYLLISSSSCGTKSTSLNSQKRLIFLKVSMQRYFTQTFYGLTSQWKNVERNCKRYVSTC